MYVHLYMYSIHLSNAEEVVVGTEPYKHLESIPFLYKYIIFELHHHSIRLAAKLKYSSKKLTKKSKEILFRKYTFLLQG